MKRCIFAMGLVLLGASVYGAQQVTPVREQSLLARVTVYWASGGGGSDHWTRKHQTSTNVRLRVGHCAVDPKRIPYGSKVLFPDSTTLVAVDTGKHVISRKAARKAGRTAAERSALVVDRFFETKGQALGWARRNPHFITLKIVPPNRRAVAPPATRMAGIRPAKERLASANTSRPVPSAPGSRYAARVP